MATKRKATTDETQEARQEVLEQQPTTPTRHELEADPTLTDTYSVWIGKRSDGTWGLHASVDGAPTLVCAFTSKRLFLRDYHRALERLGQLVFGGAIRSIR